MPTASDLGPVALAVVATLLFVGTAALAVWALVTARDARSELATERLEAAQRRTADIEGFAKAIKSIEESARVREAALEQKIAAQTTDVTRCLTLVSTIGDIVADGDPKKRVRVEASQLAARRGAAAGGGPKRPALFKDGAKVSLSDAQLWALESKKRGWKDADGLDLVGEDRADAEALAGTAEKVLEEARA